MEAKAAAIFQLIVILQVNMAGLGEAWPICEDTTGIMFTNEPGDVEVGCGADQVAVFPCMYSGTVAHPHWTINSTEYTSIVLPPDHSYSSNVLKVSNVKEKNGTQYQCFLLLTQNGATCWYGSTVGRLILNCKGFDIQSCPSYRYDNQTLKEINTIIQTDNVENAYHISYINSDDTSMMCGSATINVSSCTDGVCNHTFDIPSSSSCPNGTNITVTVTAEAFGDSSIIQIPEKIRIDAVNKFIQLNFTNIKPLRVNCTFINQPRMGIKECKIAVRPNCSNITLASEASAHDSTFVELVVAGTAMENAKRFCFLLSGYNGTRNVSVEGYYTHSGSLTDINHSPKGPILLPMLFLLCCLFIDLCD